MLISGPDTRAGHEEVDEGEADDAVVAFWEQMMRRWGNEEKYNEGLIVSSKTAMIRNHYRGQQAARLRRPP